MTLRKSPCKYISFHCYFCFSDDEEEMDPEIEEAFERFCMESDARRKKWETVRLSCEHITRPAGMFQGGRNQEHFGWFSFNFSTSTSWLQCHWIYGWDYCLVETQYNLQVRQAIKLSVAIGLAFGLWGLFYACSGLSNIPKKKKFAVRF